MVSPSPSRSDDPMMVIWERVSHPHPDGNRYILWRNRNDLDFLYDSGFVDTDRFKKEQWIEAFKDSLKTNGSYQVTLDQWLAKRPFRYAGPTGEPFDPMALAEGELEPEEFEKLLKEKILPSTTVSEEHFRKAIEKARHTAFRNGKFLVNRLFKINMRQMLLTYPSPRRIRELSVAEARLELQKPAQPVAGGKPAAAPAAKGPVQSSRYSSGPTKEKQTTDQLSRLLGKGPK